VAEFETHWPSLLDIAPPEADAAPVHGIHVVCGLIMAAISRNASGYSVKYFRIASFIAAGSYCNKRLGASVPSARICVGDKF